MSRPPWHRSPAVAIGLAVTSLVLAVVSAVFG